MNVICFAFSGEKGGGTEWLLLLPDCFGDSPGGRGGVFGRGLVCQIQEQNQNDVSKQCTGL